MNYRKEVKDLNKDMLRMIMLFVVACPGGGTNLAWTIAVCKEFSEFKKDEEILKIANFDNFTLPECAVHFVHFQHINGLLTKCAEAGNDRAKFILSQVLLAGISRSLEIKSSFPNLLLNGQASGSRTNSSYSDGSDTLRKFLPYFGVDRAVGSRSNYSKLNHLELVWFFVCRGSFLDLVCMLPHMENYMKYFGFWYVEFSSNFRNMLVIIETIVDVGRKTMNGQIVPMMRDAPEVLDSISGWLFYHFFKTDGLSQARLEDLKRECKGIEEELLTIKNFGDIMESDTRGLELGKRFLYHVAFNEPMTWEIEWPSEAYVTLLRSNCMILANSYQKYHRAAVFALCKIFLSCQGF